VAILFLASSVYDLSLLGNTKFHTHMRQPVKIRIAFCKPETLDSERALEGIQSVRGFLNAIVHHHFFPPNNLSLSHFLKIHSCMYITMLFCILVTKYRLRPQRLLMYSTDFLLFFFCVHFYYSLSYLKDMDVNSLIQRILMN
jgi:hypothetical protein